MKNSFKLFAFCLASLCASLCAVAQQPNDIIIRKYPGANGGPPYDVFVTPVAGQVLGWDSNLKPVSVAGGGGGGGGLYEDFTTLTNPTYAEKRVFYDTTEKALSYYNENSGVTVNMGQEQLIRVVNSTGSTIGSGLAVYLSGATGGLPQITLGANSAEATSRIVGVTTSSMINGATGYVTVSGVVHGIDTSAFTLGALVYLGGSGGTLTATQPTGTNYIVPIGVVRVSNASTGELVITPMGFRIATLQGNLTGAITSSGLATSLGSFTSAALLGALSDETGTGAAVFANTPTLVTPVIGAATGTSLVLTGSMTTGSGGSVAGYHDFGQGTATTATATSVGWMAPTSVTTPFHMTLPGAPTTGFLLNTGTSDPSTITFVASTGSNNVVLSTSPTITTPVVVAPNSSLNNRFRSNFSVSAQTPAAATRTYVAGSDIGPFTAAQIQVGTVIYWELNITKTAAGTASATFDIAFGTAGTTSDTARVSFTKPAGVAQIDQCLVKIKAVVKTNSASGVVLGDFTMVVDSTNVAGGFLAANKYVSAVTTTSSTFDTTTPTHVGLCVTTGASDAWTINSCSVRADNL